MPMTLPKWRLFALLKKYISLKKEHNSPRGCTALPLIWPWINTGAANDDRTNSWKATFAKWSGRKRMSSLKKGKSPSAICKPVPSANTLKQRWQSFRKISERPQCSNIFIKNHPKKLLTFWAVPRARRASICFVRSEI